ncbi:hypothetical protein ES703_91638 [subsurface metagenome]
MATGPAGDNMAVLAILLADNDASGTSGFGAVMGSKKLKAITVRGSGKVAVAEPEKLRELNKYIRELLPELSLRESGRTAGRVTPEKGKLDICRGCGLGGCQNTVYEAKNGRKGKFVCMAAGYYQVRAQRYYGEEDWSEVPFHATMLANEYGIDIDALESMIMWLSRCRQAGILTDENTGIPLSKMGSLEFIETLLKKMSLRDGFGDILAQGTTKAAALVGNGADKLITDYIIKAEQNAEHNPRFYVTNGLLYAMEPRQPIQQLHEVTGPLGAWVRWVNKAGELLFRNVDEKGAIAKHPDALQQAFLAGQKLVED